jgi:protein-S-isoprenylcysteine O-methyltransferase Ste14
VARALLRVFPFAAAVWALALVAFAEPLAPRAGVGAALVVAGWALTLWAAGYEEAGRARRAAARGSLFAGPYGWLRNPRQPAGVFVAVGLTLWSGALRPWLAVATALSLVSYFAVVQAAADREAERLLGWDYRAYRATVPIWLPRFTARPRLAAGRWRPARALKGAWPLVAGSVIVAAASLLPGRVGDLLPLR